MWPPLWPALWMAATAGHFLLTVWWVRRLDPDARSRDERWFQATLAGVGSLSFVIHLVALATGLTPAGGLAGLALWHAGLAVVLGAPWRAGVVARSLGALAARDGGTRVERVLETAAIVVLTGIAIAWIWDASTSTVVSGTDAAHYHVPVAVNLSLGARLLDLPATQHLYPMAASALVAWFILPTGGPLLVDLTILLPFALLCVSVAWIVRLTTGASGLAWATWWLLALFALPLFRTASLVSSDLLFAASFIALLAHAVDLLIRRAFRTLDVLLAGFAAGLLLGAKTTGLAALALLIAAALVAYPCMRGAVPRRAGLPPFRRMAWAVLGAVAITCGAGGVWLVRNWWLFESPIAPTGVHVFGIEVFAGLPLEASTHLSVLGDLRRGQPDYALADRLAHYVSQRLGPWYLLLLVPAALVPLDALRTHLWRQPDPLRASRLLVWGLVVSTAAALGWLLVGAPWTSLEWTRGLSLRYMLPFAVALPCLSAIGLLPSSLPWYKRTLPAAVAGAATAAAGLAVLWHNQGGASGFSPPTLRLWALGISLAVWLAVWYVARFRPVRLAGLRGAVAWLIVIAGLSAGWAAQGDVRKRSARAAAEQRQARADRRPNPERAVYLAALAAEREAGQVCASRRFFAIVRFNRPLELQSIDYRNQVFYAGRDVDLTARASTPMTACDYVISSRALIASEKGRSLIGVLNPRGDTTELAVRRPFVLLGLPR